MLSKFDLNVGYVPGKYNQIADILSRWACPASQALRDVSKHRSAQDKEELKEEIRLEREEEATCMWIKLRDPFFWK